jgi:hypothetical protein
LVDVLTEAQSSDAGEVERFPSLIRLARALEVEELTMETDIRKVCHLCLQ